MFERFTERARQIVSLAQEEARLLNSEYVGDEHLLLGCIKEGEGLAARVLENLKVDAQALRDRIPVNDHSYEVSEQTALTDKARKALELALREALSLGHNYIGTEHILLALTHQPSELVEEFLRETIDDRWDEHIRLDTLEVLRGPLPIKDSDLSAEEQEELQLKDILADLLTGYRMWKEAKQMNKEDWTDVDESFARWVDGSKVSEFL